MISTGYRFKLKKSVRLGGLIFLFVIQISSLSAQTSADSLKTNYDINDPRNPQCPCHKYQKQADDEFKKLLASARINSGRSNANVNLNHNSGFANGNHFSIANGNSNFSGFANSNSSLNKGVVHKRHFLFFKHHHKKRINLNPKWRKVCDFKNWEIFKRSIVLNSCFHWK